MTLPLNPPVPTPPRSKPGWRFMLALPAHWVALGFGAGLSPVAPGTVGTLAAWLAFALFRFIDAAKPGPVAWADQLCKGRRGEPIGWAQGFGILFDDVVAALCTLLVIALWRFMA